MTIADIKSHAQGKMDQSISAFRHNLTKIRTGRANPALLDTIHVEYYGSHVPLSQVANVSLIDARTISVQPWEKGMAAKIEKAIRESDLGLNPQVDGELIRVPIPALSEERRKELVKVAKKNGEDCKVAIRKARHDALDMLNEMKVSGDASEDEVERAKKKAEEVVAEAGQSVDQIIQGKEKEILAV